MKPTVSVVIPAYNEEKYIGQTLNSLLKQDEKPEEIIVVDNNSQDKTAEIAKKFGVKVIQEKQQGIIFARNTGFNRAKCEIIARTDADSIVSSDWVKKIKQHFSKDKELCLLGGSAGFYDLFIKTPALSKNLQRLFKKITGIDYVFGPNLAIRSSFWKKIRESLCTEEKIVHEDFDLAYHAFISGYKILFDPQLIVYISARRIKYKPHSFFLEYPYRTLKQWIYHKKKFGRIG